MEQLGQVHFARKTLVVTLILRNSPKLSHQCFVAALQLATGVRFPHGSRLLFRQDLRLGGMLTRPRSAPRRDTISCPFICLCMYLCLCFCICLCRCVIATRFRCHIARQPCWFLQSHSHAADMGGTKSDGRLIAYKQDKSFIFPKEKKKANTPINCNPPAGKRGKKV